MSKQKQPLKKKYSVDFGFECPKTGHWIDKGSTIEMLPCEACFLLQSKKLSPINQSPKSLKEKANASN